MSDFSELDSLVADLRGAPADVLPFAVKAVKVSSHNVRDDARESASRTGLEAYGRSMGYDVTVKAGAIEGEVGPTPGRRQASFGFVEDANGSVRSAPQHALRDALKANEDDFFNGLEIAVADGLRKAVGG
jgi:hypothetical protein